MVSSDSPRNIYKKALCCDLVVKSEEFAVALTTLLSRYKAQQSIKNLPFSVVLSDSPGNYYKKLCAVVSLWSPKNLAVALTALLSRFKAQQSNLKFAFLRGLVRFSKQLI